MKNDAPSTPASKGKFNAPFVRRLIRIYFRLLLAIGGPLLVIKFYLSSAGPARDAANAAISVLFGALVGTLALFSGQALYDRRKTRGELVARLPALSHEAVAKLLEFYHFRATGEPHESRRTISPERAQLARLDGAIAEFQLLWWYAFRDRKTRLAAYKLRERIALVRDFFASEELPTREAASQAVDWILTQAEKTGQFAATEAGVSLTLTGGLVFVRFGKVTAQDKLDLSFKDTPPPWKGSKGSGD
jgi:hypothetical protein